MKIVKLLALSACLLPSLSFAHNISLNQPVPSVTVKQYGEIPYINDAPTYQKWNSEHLKGKVRVLQAIAGRSSAKAMNADLMSAITLEKFPESTYQTTTIINQDDSIWGTGGFVKSSAEESKKEFSWSSMVLDENGRWQTLGILSLKAQPLLFKIKKGMSFLLRKESYLPMKLSKS